MTDDHVETPLAKARAIVWAYLLSVALWLFSIGTFWRPFRELLLLSLRDTLYSHLVVIPLITAALIYWKRREIFHQAQANVVAGLPLVAAAIAAGWWCSRRLPPSGSDLGLSLVILAGVFACAAGFLLLYGLRALRTARFPLFFLLLMVPVPRFLMDKVVFVLQVGTSEALNFLFSLAGISLYRHGFTFELPGAAIVISEECSSIHSVWALFIVSLLLGNFFLRSLLARLCLILLMAPIAILTNSIRIMTIWFLATYVNTDFLYGDLRNHAGILFSLVSLSNLLVALWLLRKLDSRIAVTIPKNYPVVSAAPRLSSMLSNWDNLSSLADFSCEFAFGESVSCRPAGHSPFTAVGLLERASNARRESVRMFLELETLPAPLKSGDHVRVAEKDYQVVEVQKDGAGAWLSLGRIA